MSGDSWEVFFEIHSGLPREAPGTDVSTREALASVPALPADPLILDLGCGPGATAILLAGEMGGHVVGLDLHRPFLDAMRQRAGEAGLGSRVAAVHGRMESTPFAPGAFDLVWSEGALYSVGLPRGLGICWDALKPHGYLAFTEAVWLENEPPEEARRWWEGEYPAITTVEANLDLIEGAGFSTLEHFTLPESAWWAYYAPLEARVDELRQRHAGERSALDVLAEAQAEIDMYRRFGRCYGYEFFVCGKAPKRQSA